MTNFSDRQRKEVTVFEDKQWNHDKAGPARLEGIDTGLQRHYLEEVHKMVERVLKTTVHLELW